MHLLQTTLIISATAMLLLTSLFFLIRTMPSRPGINWWITATFLKTLVCFYAFYSFGSSSSNASLIFFYFQAMFIVQCICIGTLSFAGAPVNIKQRMLMLAMAFVAVNTIAMFEYLFVANLCFVIYNAGNLIHAVFKINRVNDSQLSFKTTSVLMTINAIHWLDFPFLSQIEWFLPIGFILGMTLVTAIFLSLAVLSLQQFKFQTEESERNAIYAATHDSLTGLYNRSHLDTLFNQYVDRAEKLGDSFILLYLDLDGFKAINDTYGHNAGDFVLKTIAKRLSENLEGKGHVVRIGGDELVILCEHKDTNLKIAEDATQHLLKLIEQPMHQNENTYQISASIGGACYGIPHRSLENMLNETDKLMYAAKKAGKKRVYFSKSATSIGNKHIIDSGCQSATQNLSLPDKVMQEYYLN